MHKLEDYLPFWEKLNKEEQTLLKDNCKTVNYKKAVMFTVLLKNVLESLLF